MGRVNKQQESPDRGTTQALSHAISEFAKTSINVAEGEESLENERIAMRRRTAEQEKIVSNWFLESWRLMMLASAKWESSEGKRVLVPFDQNASEQRLNGQPPPEQKRPRRSKQGKIQFRIPSDVLEQLNLLARESGYERADGVGDIPNLLRDMFTHLAEAHNIAKQSKDLLR